VTKSCAQFYFDVAALIFNKVVVQIYWCNVLGGLQNLGVFILKYVKFIPMLFYLYTLPYYYLFIVIVVCDCVSLVYCYSVQLLLMYTREGIKGEVVWCSGQTVSQRAARRFICFFTQDLQRTKHS